MLIKTKYGIDLDVPDGLPWDKIVFMIEQAEEMESANRKSEGVSLRCNPRIVIYSLPDGLDTAMRAIYELQEKENPSKTTDNWRQKRNKEIRERTGWVA